VGIDDDHDDDDDQDDRDVYYFIDASVIRSSITIINALLISLFQPFRRCQRRQTHSGRFGG
jgi:hypothetical protein